MITDEKIAELRKMLEEATSGPWKWGNSEGFGPTRIYGAKELPSGSHTIAQVIGDCAQTDNNAMLIAAAVNALPELLDERDAWREAADRAARRIAQLEAALRDPSDVCCIARAALKEGPVK